MGTKKTVWLVNLVYYTEYKAKLFYLALGIQTNGIKVRVGGVIPT